MATMHAIAERPTIDAEQLELIRRTVAVGATDLELKLFLYDNARRGIHPLDRLLHFTKRGGKYTPVTSIDFMRGRAAASGELAGSDDAVFTEGNGKLVAATVTVYRLTQGQRYAYTATARWAEYNPGNAPMWHRMPRTMLAKCAEALALRKAFPQDLAGLYVGEELDQAGPLVSGSASAPPAAETGAPEDPPPPGACYLARVSRKKNRCGETWGEVVLHTGEVFIAPDETMVTFLATLAREHAPVVLTTKVNEKKNVEIVNARHWEPEEDAPKADAES